MVSCWRTQVRKSQLSRRAKISCWSTQNDREKMWSQDVKIKNIKLNFLKWKICRCRWKTNKNNKSKSECENWKDKIDWNLKTNKFVKPTKVWTTFLWKNCFFLNSFYTFWRRRASHLASVNAKPTSTKSWW